MATIAPWQPGRGFERQPLADSVEKLRLIEMGGQNFIHDVEDKSILRGIPHQGRQDLIVALAFFQLRAAGNFAGEFFNRIDRAPPAAAPLNRSFPIPCSPS